jgi:thymidylate synthase (FAD)
MLKITPIAMTIDAPTAFALDGGHHLDYPHGFAATPGTTSSDALAEFAGRACYQSWQRPNPATATNDGYLANILAQGHFSVLEHASVTLYIEGVSRALTHELIRHRHFSFSQLSQRFVDESEVTFVIPPALRDTYIRNNPGTTAQDAEDYFQSAPSLRAAKYDYAAVVDLLTAEGYTRKEVREAARAFLPNCAETKIVLTGNLRTFREFIAKRNADGVDAEMREFAAKVLAVVRIAAPHAFQDFADPLDGHNAACSPLCEGDHAPVSP